jgi:predicted nucleotidyltransferase
MIPALSAVDWHARTADAVSLLKARSIMTWAHFHATIGSVLEQVMVSQQQIDQAVHILAQAVRPVKIILFGSYARGDARHDSDVDFLVVESSVPNRRSEMARLRNMLRPLRIPVDVIVASEAELREWSHLPGHVLYWALKEGKELHEVTS